MWRLVVCLKDCVKIYSEDGQSLLGHILLNLTDNKRKEAEKNGITHYFASATRFEYNSKDYIAVANTLGEIIIIDEIKENSYNNTKISLASHALWPTGIIYSAMDNMLILSGIEGKCSVFQIKDLKKFDFIKEIEVINKKVPITGLNIIERKKLNAKWDNLLITGDFLGKIKIFAIGGFDLLMEINSHARIITSIDTRMDPSLEILTGSEDSFLNYWKIEEDDDKNIKVVLKVSFRIADQIIVGAKYLKNSTESLISIYDSNEITVLKYEK